MKQTITPERLLGEYIGELNGICAWDIPEQLREKLERRIMELQELQIEIEVQHKYKDAERGEILYPHTIKEPLFDAATHAWAVSARTYYNSGGSKAEDVFDITTMD